MDVTRAVREHLRGSHANDERCAGHLGEERVVGVDGRDAVQAHAVRMFEVDEQHADVGVGADVPEREEHPVAVVHRERDRPFVDHTHEARVAALVRALRVPVGITRRKEEHVARLDERLGVVVDAFVHQELVDPVGDAPSVEAILPVAMVVVERHTGNTGALTPARTPGSQLRAGPGARSPSLRPSAACRRQRGQ